MDCSRHLPDALVLPRRDGVSDRGHDPLDADPPPGLPAVLVLRPPGGRTARTAAEPDLR
ncbi:hypothetical protein GCM10009557_84440 [Virgisporangium ochraceum]|uniref:Uncharacterized protein n=1 Tax=Virgisporangium ochraceum TaxID=65505 RepID=A0A8J4A5X4_9ACTN|nr:hypothetical protein [Virgisporangium ochraceum]GIJ75513.1 hypothetical protein Voc01_104300 [Virgisporangium ochraceum]